MKCFTIAAAVVALFAGAAVADPPTPGQTDKGVQRKPMRPIPSDATVQGCYSSGVGLKLINQTVEFNTMGKCGKDTCNAMGYKVGASFQGSQCWCGNVYPPASTLVKDSECNIPCPGYDWDACGGPKAFTVYNTGVQLYGIDNAPEPSSSAGPSATSKPTNSPTEPVAVETSTSPSGNASNGDNNTAAIAAGVVVGVLALAAIAGGIWFWLRRRRNREIEEEHRRNAAVNAFIHGSKPGSSGGVSMTDSRMDPVMAQRRMSDGSIADNQDYSRRILRVTNA